MPDIATLQARLSAAESAYHELQLGAAQVEIQKGDRMVKFNLTSAANLRVYIGELKSELVRLGALPAESAGRRRALNVVLGG